jgi:hypothetical protein
LPNAIEKQDPSLPEKPLNLHPQCVCDGLKLVIEHMTAISFDFGDSGTIKLYSKSGEFS